MTLPFDAAAQRKKYNLLRFTREWNLKHPKKQIVRPDGFDPETDIVGTPAREFLKNMQRTTGLPVTGNFDDATMAALFPDRLRPVHIIEKTYNWNGDLGRRNGGPPGVVWHHMGGHGGADNIHAYHVSLGWRGIAYHFFVSQQGGVFRARPEWAMGGHTYMHGDWLGVCAEGNYETSEKMPKVQLEALQALHDYLHKKYAGFPDRRHRDMPQNATACPGNGFPFEKVTS